MACRWSLQPIAFWHTCLDSGRCHYGFSSFAKWTRLLCQNYLEKLIRDPSTESEAGTRLAALTAGGERVYERETCFMFHEIASTPDRVAVPCRAYSVFIMNDVGLLTRMKVQTRWKLAWDGNNLGHRISRYFLHY